tara:strand:- start:6788 stop:7111 length:324 start_codon:yes stop_codon:yes gene_type:complete
MDKQDKRPAHKIIGDALEAKIVQGVVLISKGSYLAYVTTEETELEMLKGSPYLQLKDGLQKEDFYKKARLGFEEHADFFFVYDNRALTAVQKAEQLAIESLGLEDEI